MTRTWILKRAALLIVLMTIICENPAQAAVKLITLPARQRVEIQLDNLNVTLVEEERIVPLAGGVNDVIFAWANTNIDQESIQFRCLTDPNQVRVLSVSYPPGQNALTWQVSSHAAVSARVRISYLIGQLDKSYSYRAVTSHDEQTLTLYQYLLLHNNANEEFGVAGMWPGFGERFERPLGINETKRLLSRKFENIAVQKSYLADLSANGYLDAGKKQLRIPMHYRIKNAAKNGLGQFPLQAGKVRIFQEDGRGSVAFLGEDWAEFTPRDDQMSLYLGLAKDIVVKRTIERRERTAVLGQLSDYDVLVQYEIENFKDQPVLLDIAESMHALRVEVIGDTGRQVEWELGPDGTLQQIIDTESSADRPLFQVALPPRGTDRSAAIITHTLHVHLKNEW